MINDSGKLNWRGLNVSRDRRHENLIRELVEDKETGIFSYIKDLMVFSAMLGYCYEIKKPLSDDKVPITLGTYHNSEDDGFIYLLALMEKKDAICLKDNHLASSIKIFEEYCNGGLDLIQDWFASNVIDASRLDTSEDRIWEYINSYEATSNEVDNEGLEVEL